MKYKKHLHTWSIRHTYLIDSGVQTGITPGSVKITNKNGIFGGFAGGPVVKTVLPMQGEWIAKWGQRSPGWTVGGVSHNIF